MSSTNTNSLTRYVNDIIWVKSDSSKPAAILLAPRKDRWLLRCIHTSSVIGPVDLKSWLGEPIAASDPVGTSCLYPTRNI